MPNSHPYKASEITDFVQTDDLLHLEYWLHDPKAIVPLHGELGLSMLDAIDGDQYLRTIIADELTGERTLDWLKKLIEDWSHGANEDGSYEVNTRFSFIETGRNELTYISEERVTNSQHIHFQTNSLAAVNEVHLAISHLHAYLKSIWHFDISQDY